MNIGVVFGGRSFEHEISIVSALSLQKVFHNRLVPIFLDQFGHFYLIDNSRLKASVFSSKEYKKEKKLELHLGGFYTRNLLGTKPLLVDVIINLVHGGDGEDGVLASLFDFYGVEFIGPRLEACSVSYNKLSTKMYAKEIGVKFLPYQTITHSNKETVALSYPCIIKPARLGSSLGVSVLKDESRLQYAFDSAFEFDDLLLVEPFIGELKEYNLAGCKIGKEFVFSKIEEPHKEEILDFEKKYLDFNRTETIQEAQVSKTIEKKLHESFEKIYNTSFEGALIRCDFFVIDDEVYLNEINPIPGSMANYLFDDFQDVVAKLAHNLPQKNSIHIDYQYVNTIHSAKGKA